VVLEVQAIRPFPSDLEVLVALEVLGMLELLQIQNFLNWHHAAWHSQIHLLVHLLDLSIHLILVVQEAPFLLVYLWVLLALRDLLVQEIHQNLASLKVLEVLEDREIHGYLGLRVLLSGR